MTRPRRAVIRRAVVRRAVTRRGGGRAAAGAAGVVGLSLLALLAAPAGAAAAPTAAGPAATGPGATSPAASDIAKPPRKPGRTVDLQLLAINDFHGNLEPPTGSGGRITTGGTTVDTRTVATTVDAGGVAYLGDELRRLRQGQRNTLTVAAGDMVGASPLISALFHDEPTIEALDLLGLDVSAVGNHEFDEGIDELFRLQEGGCHPTDGCQTGHPYAGAGFPFLAANVVYADTGDPIFAPYLVKEVDGVKVGFIGMTLEGTAGIVAQAGIRDVRFLDEAQTANRYVAELKRRGVESVVVLLHEGAFQASDPTFQSGLYDDCDGLNGPLVDIVERMDDEIDAVVSGHTHQPYTCEGTQEVAGKLVTSAASFGRIVTDIRLTMDRRTKDVVAASADNVIVTRDVADPALQQLVDYYRERSAPLANQPIGRISADITRTGTDDTPLGNVIADAQLAATAGQTTGGAVAAFMNPGGVRADLTLAAAGGEGAGVVTYGEAFTVQPFANNLVTKTFTGQQVLDLLAQQLTVNRWLQPAGISYAYDPATRRIDVASVVIGGARLQAGASYRITMNSFLADGGDGFSVFTAGTDTLVGGIDLDAFTAYLGGLAGPLAPPATDRIRTTG